MVSLYYDDKVSTWLTKPENTVEGAKGLPSSAYFWKVDSKLLLLLFHL